MPADGHKICPKCGIEKPFSAFAKAKNRKYGLQFACSKCKTEHHKKRYHSDEKFRRHTIDLRSRQTRENPKIRRSIKNRQLGYDFGINIEAYYALLEQQGSFCALCKTTKPTGRHNSWVLDHNHKTGEIRGFLCHRCNLDLGIYEKVVEAWGFENLNSYLVGQPMRLIDPNYVPVPKKKPQRVTLNLTSAET